MNARWITLLALLLVLPAQASERVVSIDGSLTEIVYALDAAGSLVAVDTTSRYPEAAQQLPDVGYMRQLSAEGILALRPTLVLASTDAGPDSVFTQLQQAGVRIVRIANDYSLNGVLNKVEQVAAALQRPAAGEALNARIRSEAEAALQRIPANATPPATLFILGAGNRGLMAAGTHTQADAMLELLHARNVMSYSGYKPVSPEATLQVNPQVVLVAHTGPAQGNALSTQLAMTDAFRQQRIHTLDTSLVLGFGPRIGMALNRLVDLLYPPAKVAGGQP